MLSGGRISPETQLNAPFDNESIAQRAHQALLASAEQEPGKATNDKGRSCGVASSCGFQEPFAASPLKIGVDEIRRRAREERQDDFSKLQMKTTTTWAGSSPKIKGLEHASGTLKDKLHSKHLLKLPPALGADGHRHLEASASNLKMKNPSFQSI